MFSMRNLKIITIVFSLLLTLNFAYARKRQIVGKVVMVRGSVTYLAPGMMKAGKVKKGQSFIRETSILTGKSSFIRVRFVDGSFLNLGASSKVILDEFKKTKPGVISLLKGKVRAQIPKKTSLGKMQDDYKFYIKTRNASIGVRGTDFLTLHNTDSKVTSVLTFEGKVGVSNLEESLLLPSLRKKIIGTLKRDDLNSILQSGNTQIVTKGKLSGVFPAFKRSIIPVKISPSQFELLEKNGNLNFTGKGRIDKYIYEDPSARKGEKRTKQTRKQAEGFYDDVNERFQPKAGGYLDISSGIYIQPEPGSKYDKQNNVFIVSGEFGKVDKEHGNYVPPKGLKIDNRKGFVLEDMSDENRLDLAREVFGITEGKLSKSIRNKMEKSLQQILVTKKAILNQEVKTDILKTPLDDDEFIYEISREFNRMKYMFKEVLKTKLSFQLGQDSSGHEFFYHELVKNTDKSVNFLNAGVSVSYSNYITNKLIVRPKARFSAKYQISPENNDVKEMSQTNFDIMFDGFYNYTLFKIPTTLIFGIQVTRDSKLEKDHSDYENPYIKDTDQNTLYRRDVLLRLGKSLRFNEFNTAGVELSFFNYDGFSNQLNGTGNNIKILYSRKFLPRYEIRLSSRIQNLSAKVDSGSSSAMGYGLGFNTYDIADYYSILTEIEMDKIEFDDSSRKLTQGDEEKLQGTLKIRRRLEVDWMLEFGYTYTDYKSKDTSRDMTSNKLQLGAYYEF